MVISQLGYGGAEGSYLRLAGFLSRYFDVTIALMARDYGSSDYSACSVGDRSAGGACSTMNVPSEAGLLSKALRWWRMVRRLRKLKCEYDVTISFMSGPNFLNALAGHSRYHYFVGTRFETLRHWNVTSAALDLDAGAGSDRLPWRPLCCHSLAGPCGRDRQGEFRYRFSRKCDRGNRPGLASVGLGGGTVRARV